MDRARLSCMYIYWFRSKDSSLKEATRMFFEDQKWHSWAAHGPDLHTLYFGTFVATLCISGLNIRWYDAWIVPWYGPSRCTLSQMLLAVMQVRWSVCLHVAMVVDLFRCHPPPTQPWLSYCPLSATSDKFKLQSRHLIALDGWEESYEGHFKCIRGPRPWRCDPGVKQHSGCVQSVIYWRESTSAGRAECR